MGIGSDVVPVHEWETDQTPWNTLNYTLVLGRPSGITSHEGEREALQEGDWTTSSTSVVS